MIVLPALPHSCSVALTAYNKTALDSLIATARASASCLPKELPTLPLSGAEFDAQRIAADYDFDTDMCIKAGGAFEGHAFSAFALLSGCAHAHVTLEGVVARARACTSLHRGTVPVVPGADGDGEGGEMMLNAYVLDFFSHAHFATIVRDNGVPSGTAWQVCSVFFSLLRSSLPC